MLFDAEKAGDPWRAMRRATAAGADQLVLHVEGMEARAIRPGFDLVAEAKAIPWFVLEEPVVDAWEIASAGILKAARQLTWEVTTRPTSKVVRNPFTVTEPIYADELALSFLESEGLDLARRLTRQNRRTILGVLERGIAEGWSIPRIVKAFKGAVGLLPRDERALRNRETRLRSRGGLSERRIQADLKRYRKTLILRRSTLIARTETVRATNVGQHQAWMILQRQGDLPAQVWRDWIVAADERLCPICKALGRQPPVRLNEAFEGGHMTPPAHPACRCSMSLRFSRGRA